MTKRHHDDEDDASLEAAPPDKGARFEKCFIGNDVMLSNEWGASVEARPGRKAHFAIFSDGNLAPNSHLGESELAEIIGMTPGSQDLTLKCLNLAYTQVTDAFLFVLAQHAPTLQRLLLDGCQGVTDCGLAFLAQSCGHMTSLSLAKCGRISDRGFEAIALGMPMLSALNVTDCAHITGHAISAIVTRCPLLGSLRIGGTSVGADALTRVVSLLLLVELDVSGLPLGDAHVRQLARHQPLLRSLTMNFCREVTAPALAELVDSLKIGRVIAFGVEAAAELVQQVARLVY